MKWGKQLRTQTTLKRVFLLALCVHVTDATEIGVVAMQAIYAFATKTKMLPFRCRNAVFICINCCTYHDNSFLLRWYVWGVRQQYQHLSLYSPTELIFVIVLSIVTIVSLWIQIYTSGAEYGFKQSLLWHLPYRMQPVSHTVYETCFFVL